MRPFAATIVLLGVCTSGTSLIACARSGARPPVSPKPTAIADAGPEASGPPEPDVPSLESLAARGPIDMPMIREVTRVPDANARPTELEAKAADTCYRAVVAAGLPFQAWFEDDKRARRGEVASASAMSASALVPPRGPACARKGETLRLVVDAPARNATTIVRAVVWQAP